MAKKPSEETTTVTVPIEWRIPSEVAARHATHFVVQRDENEYFLMFFDLLRPPMLGGDPIEAKKAIEAAGAVPAICVARIALSPQKFGEVVETLSKFAKDQQLRSASSEEESRD